MKIICTKNLLTAALSGPPPFITGGRTSLPGFNHAPGQVLNCGVESLSANLLPAPEGFVRVDICR